MKVKIEKIFDTKGIGCFCMVCGKNLGHVEYIEEHSSWNIIDYLPVCNKCFSRYGLPMVSMDKIQHPFQK